MKKHLVSVRFWKEFQYKIEFNNQQNSFS